MKHPETYSGRTRLFMSRFYHIMREDPPQFILKKLRTKRGWYTEDKHLVELDHRLDFISTAIHEMLHAIHPKAPEMWVRKNEVHLINQLSHRQIKNILKTIIDHL